MVKCFKSCHIYGVQKPIEFFCFSFHPTLSLPLINGQVYVNIYINIPGHSLKDKKNNVSSICWILTRIFIKSERSEKKCKSTSWSSEVWGLCFMKWWPIKTHQILPHFYRIQNHPFSLLICTYFVVYYLANFSVFY